MESLDFCRKNKGMEIYAWCIMPSHMHLIFRAKNNNPGDLLRDLKTFTSKKINPHYSWELAMKVLSAIKSSA